MFKQLFNFQEEAAQEIAQRFFNYHFSQRISHQKKQVTFDGIPFFQFLDAITGAGKTVILVRTISLMSQQLETKPIILWLSKLSVVVKQSMTRLEAGGEYFDLFGNKLLTFSLDQYKESNLEEDDHVLLFLATVGTFNQKDKEEGDRKIFACNIDNQNKSTWESLKIRKNSKGRKRELFIVYDEGHNLSNQQIKLLLDLEPAVFLLASGTIQLPSKINEEFQIPLDKDYLKKKKLILKIPTAAVSKAELIKGILHIHGYESSMEATITKMVGHLTKISYLTKEVGLRKPKAIYVCKTNIREEESFLPDNPNKPFLQRKAPPILIWRHLVEKCKIEPSKIAVCCSLKFTKQFPKDDNFIFFPKLKNEKQYKEFIEGDFQHIIFNKSLQEGWDDPLVYCAYIDKSVGSEINVRQIIGRVLRQPKQKYYQNEWLNTGSFYIKIDKKEEFEPIIQEINTSLKGEIEIKTFDEQSKPKEVDVRPDLKRLKIPQVNRVVEEELLQELKLLINEEMGDWREDEINTTFVGSRQTVIKKMLDSDSDKIILKEFAKTNKVTARVIFISQIKSYFPKLLGISDIENAKFNALIGYGSSAFKNIIYIAKKAIKIYTDHIVLEQDETEPESIKQILVYPDKDPQIFKKSLHNEYSGLNDLELAFARQLDEIDNLWWCRNQSRSGYKIPLVSNESGRNFYPDFLIWHNKCVIAADTSGEHLLQEKIDNKMPPIKCPDDAQQKLVICFFAKGKYYYEDNRIKKTTNNKKNVWSMIGKRKNGKIFVKVSNSLQELIHTIV